MVFWNAQQSCLSLSSFPSALVYVHLRLDIWLHFPKTTAIFGTAHRNISHAYGLFSDISLQNCMFYLIIYINALWVSTINTVYSIRAGWTHSRASSSSNYTPLSSFLSPPLPFFSSSSYPFLTLVSFSSFLLFLLLPSPPPFSSSNLSSPLTFSSSSSSTLSFLSSPYSYPLPFHSSSSFPPPPILFSSSFSLLSSPLLLSQWESDANFSRPVLNTFRLFMTFNFPPPNLFLYGRFWVILRRPPGNTESAPIR